MLTPTSGTLADYHSAILAGNKTHARITFPVQSVVLTDDNISVDGGIQMTAIMNTEDDLVFGKAVSTEVRIFLLNGNVFSGFDWTEEFKLEFGVEISGTTNWVVVGWFKGTKPERTMRTDVIEFVAYDRMQAFDVLADEFLASVTYPVTMSTLYHDLCTYCGVGYAVGSEMADSMSVSYAEDPFADGITCRMLLAWIAEANCTVAKINADGDVILAWYTDQTAKYSINENNYFDINISENTVPAIDCVDINSTDTEVSGFIYPVGGTNPYHIIDNPLLMFLGAATKTTIITNMITRLSAIANYIPTAVAAFGNWLVETGDIISVGYDNGSTMHLPVFNKAFVWAGAGEDTYECTGKAERTALTGSAKDEYVLGGKLSNKYTIVTGVDIDDDGITVSGAKYIKIISGGTLDVQSQNFTLNSNDGTMVSGNWHFTEDGMYHLDTEEHGYTRMLSIGGDPGVASDFNFKILTDFHSRHPSGGTNWYYGALDFITKGEGLRFTDVWGDLVPNDGGSSIYGGGIPALIPITNGVGYLGHSDKQFEKIFTQNLFTTNLNHMPPGRCVRLLATDNTWAKIWAKISVLNTGETATIFCNNIPYSIINGGTDTSGNPSGTICRTTSTTFNFLLKWTGNDIFGARIDNASSSSAGTYSATFYHEQIGTLSSLNTSSKTSLVSAINEVNGKVLKDNIVYQSSATTHQFTVSTNSRNFVILSGNGLSYTFIGFVYCSSNGTVTVTDLYTGSNIGFIGLGTNKITFQFANSSGCYLRSVNLYGSPLS